MSHDSTPITLTRFSSALTELPIDAIYSKHAELRNSIAHMEASNTQLEDYARDNDDRECYEALLENRQVIKRFEERIVALRREVTEVRGLPWRPIGSEEEVRKQGEGVNGVVNGEQRNGAVGGEGAGAQGEGRENGVFL